MVRLAARTWEPGGAAGNGSTNGSTNGDGGGLGGGDGRREPFAVLVHGITSSSTTWWRVGPALAERGWRVLAVDLRGHGHSPSGTGGIGVADLAADVAETVRAEAAERGPGLPGGAVDLLVGHSLGALTVMELVRREPGFARRVVLEDPPSAEAFDSRQMAADMDRDARRARTEPAALRADLMAPPTSLPRRDAELKVAELARLDVDGVTASLADGFRFDIVDLARGVTAPTLLVLGQERLGSALLGEARAAVATGLADGRTEVLPSGHTVHREAYESFMHRLDAWLDANTHA